jgi:hypothetical protein
MTVANFRTAASSSMSLSESGDTVAAVATDERRHVRRQMMEHNARLIL